MNILIIDDEAIIRNGLERAISQFDGFRVAGTADDGETALDWLRSAERLPDLIITDIFMQYIDGLDFIDKVNELYPGIKCVILSGHEEFHLARKAIDLKVCRYITKPVEPAELYSVLDGIRSELQKEWSRRSDLLRMEQAAANATLYVRDKLLSDLLEGRLVSRSELREFEGCFPFSLEEPFVGGVVRVCKYGKLVSQRDMLLYSVAVKQLFTEVVLSKCSGFVMIKDTGTLVFGTHGETSDSSVIESFAAIAESVLGIPVLLELGEVAQGLFRLQSALAGAIARVDNRMKDTVDKPLRNGVAASEEEPNKPDRGGELVDSVIMYMQQHYADHALSLQQLAELVPVHPNYLTQTFRKRTGLSCMQYLARLRMEKAKELLHRSDLKICDIAVRVGYENPLYFSSYFKKWVGMNPTVYKDGLGTYA